MTDQELRQLVRDAIAKAGAGASVAGRVDAAPYDHRVLRHSSHAMFTLAPADPDGRCVIEPGVPCNHCGYCKSYGH